MVKIYFIVRKLVTNNPSSPWKPRSPTISFGSLMFKEGRQGRESEGLLVKGGICRMTADQTLKAKVNLCTAQAGGTLAAGPFLTDFQPGPE